MNRHPLPIQENRSEGKYQEKAIEDALPNQIEIEDIQASVDQEGVDDGNLLKRRNPFLEDFDKNRSVFVSCNCSIVGCHVSVFLSVLLGSFYP